MDYCIYLGKHRSIYYFSSKINAASTPATIHTQLTTAQCSIEIALFFETDCDTTQV